MVIYKGKPLIPSYVNKLVTIRFPKTKHIKYAWITKQKDGMYWARFPRFNTPLKYILTKKSIAFHWAVQLSKKTKVYHVF